MSSPFSNVIAAAADGRTHNIYFRQSQLKSLHDCLRSNSHSIQDAISKDCGITEAEVADEFALTLDSIKQHYSTLNAEAELVTEYSIANHKDAADRRVPYGVVYIEPQLNHTPFFSAVAPLSAAVAAGNCVVMRLENNLFNLPPLLRSILSKALDGDICTITSTDPPADFLASVVQVLQRTETSTPTYQQLASNPGRKVVAIVDRTADLEAAAESLVTARFGFGGTSPYAPDLVLVNEFVKKDFIELALRRAISHLSGSNAQIFGKEKFRSSANENTEEILADFRHSNDFTTKVVTKGDAGAIIELVPTALQPSFSALPKIIGPIFCVAAATSLDHAIDTASSISNAPLLATYHFADLKTSKYTSQFVASEISFINHIPIPLLIGPAAPAHQPFQADMRYTPTHFSRTSPQLVILPKSHSRFATGQKGGKGISLFIKEATEELSAQKRPESIATGFFEQGIFIGLGIYGIPLLMGIGTGFWYAGRFLLASWKAG